MRSWSDKLSDKEVAEAMHDVMCMHIGGLLKGVNITPDRLRMIVKEAGTQQVAHIMAICVDLEIRAGDLGITDAPSAEDEEGGK